MITWSSLHPSVVSVSTIRIVRSPFDNYWMVFLFIRCDQWSVMPCVMWIYQSSACPTILDLSSMHGSATLYSMSSLWSVSSSVQSYRKWSLTLELQLASELTVRLLIEAPSAGIYAQWLSSLLVSSWAVKPSSRACLNVRKNPTTVISFYDIWVTSESLVFSS